MEVLASMEALASVEVPGLKPDKKLAISPGCPGYQPGGNEVFRKFII
jgi:hypothetical protein